MEKPEYIQSEHPEEYETEQDFIKKEYNKIKNTKNKENIKSTFKENNNFELKSRFD